MKILFSVLLFISHIMAACSIQAESVDSLVAIMNQKLANKTTHYESVVRGGLRVRLCQYCHGKDGNSQRGEIPNLAEQNPVYLLTQFEHFRSKQRKYKVMNELAQGLTKEERINIALYYASQKVVVATAAGSIKVGARAHGAKIYKNVCANCHGEKGYGDKALPRIAGQKYEFINNTLSAYKNKQRIRPDSPMASVSAALSNEEILAIASYVSLMQ